MSLRTSIFKIINRLLRLAHLKPLNLGEKCRLQFGFAILVVLTIALLIPYFWINKLTELISLNAGRAVANTFFARHLQVDLPPEQRLPPLYESGDKRSPEDTPIRWVPLDTSQKNPLENLSLHKQRIIKQLIDSRGSADFAWLERNKGLPTDNYIQVVRAKERCMSCHHSEGSTNSVFSKNQPVGAILVRTPAREIGKILFINRTMIIVAYVLAATGAMIAFYAIAQRIILSPIRQLRALVSNVSEGNLDVRSSIKSNDEYEKLSNAFNEMLDGLQLSQKKLRDANTQLDAKIAQLSDRNIELFKANQLKSEFLANMSHEFKTPLNSILGFAQLLKEKPADNPEKSKRYAENIISSGRSLLNMITDLLDLAKAEAGKIELKIEKTSISDLCQGVVAFFTPMTVERKIRINLNVAEDIPIIRTDNAKVQQILYNLLSNAIKFSPENGLVEIRAKMLDDLTVRISVTDRGPGISKENQVRIFEKFRQLDGSITRNTSGTGLGLAISKELADLLAGSLSVESELEKGATFYLDIPVNLPRSDKKE